MDLSSSLGIMENCVDLSQMKLATFSSTLFCLCTRFEKVENAQRWIRWVFRVTKKHPTALGMCTMNIPIWFDCSCTNGSPGWYSSRILVSKMCPKNGLLAKFGWNTFNNRTTIFLKLSFFCMNSSKRTWLGNWNFEQGQVSNLFQGYLNDPATGPERETSSRKSPTRL